LTIAVEDRRIERQEPEARMATSAWIALIDWVDGNVEDTDEIRVFANTAAEAELAAHTRWSATTGAEWPHCRIERIEIFSPARLRGVV
jgi:hypothetical protein